MEQRPLHVHGPGRAATSLAVMLARAGWDVVSVSGGRGETVPAPLAAAAPRAASAAGPDGLPAGAVVLVGVRDDGLAEALAGLARRRLPEGALVVHLSGARGLDAFPVPWPAARGALHPLCSFPTKDPGGRDLGGALVAVAADEDAHAALLERLARDAGGRPFRLDDAGRGAYHLGASVASNGLVALLDVAADAFARAGVPPELAPGGLARLASGTLANVAGLGAADALTGPVVRGDVGVLDRHLEALSGAGPAARALYLGVVAVLVDVARRRDAPGADAAARWLDGQAP